MTQEELNALAAILQRAPVTPGELLWLQGLISRLQAQITAWAQLPEDDRKLMQERGWSWNG